MTDFYREERPWGRLTNLHEEPGFKVKKIEVKPGASLSLQMHHKRAEHWPVISSEGNSQAGEQILKSKEGDYCFIPQGEIHRLSNTT